MRKNFIAVVTLATSIFFVSCGEQSASTEEAAAAPTSVLEGDIALNVDITKSSVKWAGEMLGIKDHQGTVNIKDAKLQLKDGQVTGGSFTIDMNTLVATDANYQPDQGYTKEKLIGHLASADFFDIANNPVATFTITSVSGNSAKGNLTVRGKTNEETITDIVVAQEGEGVKVSGKLKFNRKNYGVAFDMPTTDMIISDDINIGVDLIAAR